jgi:hypothetical protein
METFNIANIYDIIRSGGNYINDRNEKYIFELFAIFINTENINKYIGPYGIKENIYTYYSNFPIAIETGTFKGEGTFKLSQYFKKVYTIELNKKLYNDANERFKNMPKIKCIYGHSTNELNKLIHLTNYKKKGVCFFLDAYKLHPKWNKKNKTK